MFVVERGFDKMAANVRACCCAGILYRSARTVSPIEKLLMKICTKDEEWKSGPYRS